MRFLTQMFRMPMAALAYGMDLLAKAMHELQRGAGHARDSPSGAAAQNSFPSIERELSIMVDQDLSSDELKTVRFRIIFKKRDYEVTLHAGEALVNYPTDGGSFGAIQILKYFKRVAEGTVPRPQKWREMNYPNADSPNHRWEIPERDGRYIGFQYEVIRREERQEKEYDRDQVQVLREIANNLADD